MRAAAARIGEILSQVAGCPVINSVVHYPANGRDPAALLDLARAKAEDDAFLGQPGGFLRLRFAKLLQGSQVGTRTAAGNDQSARQLIIWPGLVSAPPPNGAPSIRDF